MNKSLINFQQQMKSRYSRKANRNSNLDRTGIDEHHMTEMQKEHNSKSSDSLAVSQNGSKYKTQVLLKLKQQSGEILIRQPSTKSSFVNQMVKDKIDEEPGINEDARNQILKEELKRRHCGS